MNPLAGRVGLLTGASGGIGTVLASALAAEGMNLVLTANPGTKLADLKHGLGSTVGKTVTMVHDLRYQDQVRLLFEQSLAAFGRVDVLINNAGIEFTAAYHELEADSILDVMRVNLEAPMLLARWFLPGMLERRCGHIVNMASLAGKAGPAFQEPYAATKAALIAFTASLRATYRDTGVSASVIIPGFVEAGIYERLHRNTGYAAPGLLGTSPAEAVARGLVRAVKRNLPEVIVNPYPVRPLFALNALSPRVGECLIRWTGAHAFFARAARVLKEREIKSGNPPRSSRPG
jgi:short-subunit dehydrogenase